MYLAAAHRGRGLGRALLDRARAEARQRSAVRVTLETATALKEAVGLYERAGFRRQPFAPHVCRCDVAMELELPFERQRGDITISTDLRRFNLGQVHTLLGQTYWAAGIPEDTVARSLANSLCFGLFQGPEQIGLARVVTDRATYAYLCDVIVAEAYRGQGLGRWLIEGVLAHPDLAGVRRFQLVTRDMQPLYVPFGFQVSAHPERHLEISRPDLYRKAST
jgi:ribosomal protein S18 acetylase RimI-like enzyme